MPTFVKHAVMYLLLHGNVYNPWRMRADYGQGKIATFVITQWLQYVWPDPSFSLCKECGLLSQVLKVIKAGFMGVELVLQATLKAGATKWLESQ